MLDGPDSDYSSSSESESDDDKTMMPSATDPGQEEVLFERSDDSCLELSTAVQEIERQRSSSAAPKKRLKLRMTLEKKSSKPKIEEV
ncbi:unnamed protein product [Soboliphyme baturini]|uniref:Uncharacterized protein n=1 Tax=Soboliphyme baturini TaxID=241478 RepID=A0A183IUT9_9BILA|nr:unnamed protein product [Soboliphyme baturini]